MKPSNHQFPKWVALFCLLAIQNQAAQFVEISAEIDFFGYELGVPDAPARAEPKTFHVTCTTGSSQWYIENDYQSLEEWLFDGTNVVCRTQPRSEAERARILKSGSSTSPITKPVTQTWPSRDGHPMGHYGVNIPWVAFCSGNYLKREGRVIPLPAAI